MKTFTCKLTVMLLSIFIFGTNAYAIQDTTSFKITIQTDNSGDSGASGNTQFIIPTTGDGYDYTVNCGDGSLAATSVTGNYTCNYAASGTYQITISGTFPRIYFNNSGDKLKILSVDQWGTQEWSSMGRAFMGAENLDIVATDVPDLSNVTDMSYAFRYINSINSRVADWDVSNVENMSSLFEGITSFNEDISGWNVSSVTTMNGLFSFCQNFNRDIGDWNVSSVRDMNSMFQFNASFVQDIGRWNVSKVADMSFMFSAATNFDHDIGDWNVSSVLKMEYMFQNADTFNQDIGNWNVSKVKTMQKMFKGVDAFSQNLNNWNVSNVENMLGLFVGATAFNGDIGNWDTSKVTDMSSMFDGASNFNQDIGDWNVSAVTTMNAMFRDAPSFNQDIGNWDISLVADMRNMFERVTLSVSNYDNLLNSWEAKPIQTDINFHAGNSQYCEGDLAKFSLENDSFWTITDGGESCVFYINSTHTYSVPNAEQIVGTVTTTFPDPQDNIFEIVEVGDGDKFTINDNGELSFINPPDARHPADANSDNVYRVQVYACDSSMCFDEDYQTIEVTVEPNDIAPLVPIINYLLF